ncbi:MAG: hypothetical protein WAW10_08620 [Gallionella sp.]
MKKIFNLVLALCFLDAFISCAYAHSLIFGPEFFSSEDGKSRQIIKNFSVQDASQRYIVSVQNGASSKKGAIRGGININGKLIFPAVEMGERPKMFTKYVRLQKKNKISVDVANGAAMPIIVTVMSLKEQAVTARIPPIGNAVDVEGYASIIFPAGTFDISQKVTVSVSASPAMQDIFETNAAGPRLPYEIRVNTGNRAPKKDVEVSVRYPDSFFSSDYQIHVFAHMHDNPDAPDVHDRFFMISSGLDDKVNMTMATLPRHAFSKRHSKNGTYEAVITVGLVH